jgi:hypothetical protein
MAKGFNNISVISWWKPEYPEKTTDLLRVPDKLHYIMYFFVELEMNDFFKGQIIHLSKSLFFILKKKVFPSKIFF